jgi:hypothetical protein
MLFNAAAGAFRAVNCDSNRYGATNITHGLAALPCRDCPAGTQANTSLPRSAAYWVSDGAGKQGFISPLACVTRPGWDWNGRTASKCPAGSYSAGNLERCTACPEGLSTADDASAQVDVSNCTLAVGYGFHDNAVVPCPLGELALCSTRLPVGQSVFFALRCCVHYSL